MLENLRSSVYEARIPGASLKTFRCEKSIRFLEGAEIKRDEKPNGANFSSQGIL